MWRTGLHSFRKYQCVLWGQTQANSPLLTDETPGVVFFALALALGFACKVLSALTLALWCHPSLSLAPQPRLVTPLQSPPGLVPLSQTLSYSPILPTVLEVVGWAVGHSSLPLPLHLHSSTVCGVWGWPTKQGGEAGCQHPTWLRFPYTASDSCTVILTLRKQM